MLLELAFMAQMLKECQNEVEPNLLIGLITNNPYSISVMGAETATPPETEGEAIKVINDLAMKRISFNAGMMKIHNGNFQELGIDNNNVFDVCTNIKAGASILASCLPETVKTTPETIGAAYSCYRSKNLLPLESTPMQLSPQDLKALSAMEADPIPQNSAPKKVEAWDVFKDFSN